MLRAAARVLGWPFQWLGLEGDPSQPPILQGADRARAAYIKFGQLLSTRPDVVGPELAAELSGARTSCRPSRWTRRAPRSRPSPMPAARGGLRELRPPVAASLAQVHRATLRETGQVVAVKVLRPGIERAFLRDVDAFHFAASIIELWRRSPGGSGRARSSTTSRAWCSASSTCGWRPRPRPVRGQHRARPRLPGAGGDLVGLGPPGADARVGLGGQPRRRPGAARHRFRPHAGSPSG